MLASEWVSTMQRDQGLLWAFFTMLGILSVTVRYIPSVTVRYSVLTQLWQREHCWACHQLQSGTACWHNSGKENIAGHAISYSQVQGVDTTLAKRTLLGMPSVTVRYRVLTQLWQREHCWACHQLQSGTACWHNSGKENIAGHAISYSHVQGVDTTLTKRTLVKLIENGTRIPPVDNFTHSWL